MCHNTGEADQQHSNQVKYFNPVFGGYHVDVCAREALSYSEWVIVAPIRFKGNLGEPKGQIKGVDNAVLGIWSDAGTWQTVQREARASGLLIT